MCNIIQVAAQLREMSLENFKRWLKALLKTHIWNFISSKAIYEQLGGLIAVDELIDVAHDDATSIIANYIRIGLKSSDASVMILAAKALGHLSRINRFRFPRFSSNFLAPLQPNVLNLIFMQLLSGFKESVLVYFSYRNDLVFF